MKASEINKDRAAKMGYTANEMAVLISLAEFDKQKKSPTYGDMMDATGLTKLELELAKHGLVQKGAAEPTTN